MKLKILVGFVVCCACGGFVYWEWKQLNKPPVDFAAISREAQKQIEAAPPREAPPFYAPDDRSTEYIALDQARAQKVYAVINRSDRDLPTATAAVKALPSDALPILEAEIAKPDVSPQARQILTDALKADAARLRAATRQQKLAEWYRATALDIFDPHTPADAPWKHAARICVEAWVRNLDGSVQCSGDEDMIVYREGWNGYVAGCRDPLFVCWWMANRIAYHQGNVQENLSMLHPAQKAMESSDYPAVRKLEMDLRMAMYMSHIRNRQPEENKQIDQFMAHSQELFEQVIADPSLPREAFLGLCDLLQDVSMDVYGDRAKLVEQYCKAAENSLIDRSTIQTARGKMLCNYAWDARGGGWANTVTDDGWKNMAKRLDEAQKDLEEAWKLDPTNDAAATEMISVCLGKQLNRDQMELWFKRAMDANPDNYAACAAKLYYLEPKWYGSPQEMLEFGRQCEATGNWTAQLPMILVHAHINLSYYANQDYTMTVSKKYFDENPQAWEDVRRVMEQAEANRPRSQYRNERYAQIAVLCEQWKIADDHFRDTHPWPDPRVYGSQGELDRDRNLCKQKIKELSQASTRPAGNATRPDSSDQ